LSAQHDSGKCSLAFKKIRNEEGGSVYSMNKALSQGGLDPTSDFTFGFNATLNEGEITWMLMKD
jgi:hypothetical protein